MAKAKNTSKKNKQADKTNGHGKSLTMRQHIEGAQNKADNKEPSLKAKIKAESSKPVKSSSTAKKTVSKTTKATKKPVAEEKTFFQAFIWGFTLPLIWLWKIIKIILWPVIWLLKHIVPPYFKNSWKELKLVTWPTTRVTTSLTFAVLMFAVVFGAIVAVVDFGLDKAFKDLFLK